MGTYLQIFVDMKDIDPTITINPDSLYVKEAITLSNYGWVKLWFRGLDGRLYKTGGKSVDDVKVVRTEINNQIAVLNMPDNSTCFSLDARASLNDDTTADFAYYYDSVDGEKSEITGSGIDIARYLGSNANLASVFTALGFDWTCESGTYNPTDVWQLQYKIRIKVDRLNFYSYVYDWKKDMGEIFAYSCSSYKTTQFSTIYSKLAKECPSVSEAATWLIQGLCS